jgi:hypothetical protein
MGLRYRTGRVKPKSTSQDSDLSDKSRPENLSPKNLSFERVNEVTFEVTGDEQISVPTSHGWWGGYRTAKALAWVIHVDPGAWLARCRNRACGPSSFIEARANAIALANGAAGDYFVENPIGHLNGLQALLLVSDEGA